MSLWKFLLRATPAKRPASIPQYHTSTTSSMNRQNRQTGPERGGRGGRGGRGRGRGRGGSRPSHPHVPPFKAITPGTSVNIILKADQPTGRTVSGLVSDLLTRGDHPRGVKVRLADGRVGRVQSIRNGEPTPEPDVMESTQGASFQIRAEGGDGSGKGNRFASRDMRLDGPEEPEAEPLGLDMYIRPAKGKKKGKKTQAGQNEGSERREDAIDTGGPAQKSGSLKCPVCGDFEGDEAAVAHHVAGHFGE
ncbi:unnamed protein product [Penicillium salamii]|uniref:Uncharacterized protein n=1 Tax=Penicillium salamii TaxID=1612424 RepID=A0A9W4NDR1_9EURO|nr:unnamed protein product [Penicillium salamii]CAG7967331.1 unnamed protein product [Penicillium salamii]CAG7992917.1 unnamed protein product [Penicillium salamii]CAG8181414.1 unnamed protein product [Penicillium salamii]CAG8183306.1 unnamed protein product [Penicillium salamii]